MKRSTTGAAGRLAGVLMAPAVTVVAALSLLPIAATAWDALHVHDLRLPWLGYPFVGLANVREALRDPRAVAAVIHTVLFTLVSVPIELTCGLALALLMHNAVHGRAVVRTVALLPWAIPSVVAALVWRFMFDAQTGFTPSLLAALGHADASFDWFTRPLAAWVPVVGADVWKTTPFVAVLLLAGLQTIDPSIDEAARVDGAGGVQRLMTVTLPMLRPSLIVAAAFRSLDALRLFDLSYVITGGGPGTATEPLSLYAYVTLTQRLRYGYGAALSMMMFALTLACALVWVRALGRSLDEARR